MAASIQTAAATFFDDPVVVRFALGYRIRRPPPAIRTVPNARRRPSEFGSSMNMKFNRLYRRPLDDVLACLERIVTVRSPLRVLPPLLLSLVVSWVIYVPIHELLHAFGCWLGGGEVTKLEISARYGGGILAKFLPFVVTASEYAGRLSGFDTKGSDLTYLLTDFMPFVLSVVLGVPLLKIAGRKRRPMIFGLAVVTGLAPFYNLPGDYFEMGSIVVTRTVTLLRGWTGPPAYAKLRSDDIFKLLETYCTDPAQLDLSGTMNMLGGASVIVLSLAVAVLLAFLTYAMGHAFARALLPPRSRQGL